jgi:DNA-binding NarL/FixJ family response regulator
MNNKLKVAIVEDNPEYSNRYKGYISSSELMDCVGTASSVENFLKYITNFSDLDILLLDIELPGISGIQAIPKIKAKIPDVNIVMLTSFSDDETVFQAIRSGAMGYLLKDCTQSELQRMLIAVPEGGSPISPCIARKIINYFTPPKSTFIGTKGEDPLTKTERLVVHNLVKGLTYQEIANQMDVSINSVRHHVKNIYQKLQVQSRNKLVDKVRQLFAGI